MSLFQWLGLSVLAVLAVLTVSAGVRGQVRKRIVTFWLLVWGGGAVLLVWPSSAAIAAHKLGIGRGADLLLYSSVLVMFSGFFYVYTRFRRLDRQITMLVRRLAIENAARPAAGSSHDG
ncbi:MAG TPA: DUF2304 domain-containing protein [Polyangiales bacterium]